MFMMRQGIFDSGGELIYATLKCNRYVLVAHFISPLSFFDRLLLFNSADLVSRFRSPPTDGSVGDATASGKWRRYDEVGDGLKREIF